MKDPNADLVNFRFETERGDGRVLHTAHWSDGQYVVIDVAGVLTVRQAEQVRYFKATWGGTNDAEG